MQKHLMISAAAMLAASTMAFAGANQGPGGAGNAPKGDVGSPGNAGGGADMPRGNSGNAPAARDSAPGQMKGDRESARDEAPGQVKGDRESARDDAPGRTKGDRDSARDNAPGQTKDAKSSDGNADKSDKRAGDNDGSRKGSGSTGASDGSSGSGSDKAQGKNLAEIPAEKKSQVRSAFGKHRVEPARDLNISVNVGVTVPRSVRLYSVPQDIVVIYPAYRDYRYFYVDDRICIVDPDTFEIVEVIVIA